MFSFFQNTSHVLTFTHKYNPPGFFFAGKPHGRIKKNRLFRSVRVRCTEPESSQEESQGTKVRRRRGPMKYGRGVEFDRITATTTTATEQREDGGRGFRRPGPAAKREAGPGCPMRGLGPVSQHTRVPAAVYRDRRPHLGLLSQSRCR